MIFLAIVGNTKAVPAVYGLGNLGLITYTQFEFQDGIPGASSTRSIVGHGEGHISRQPALHNACMPVASPGLKDCNKAMRRR